MNLSCNFVCILYFFYFLLLSRIVTESIAQLVINVKNQGGDVLQEILLSNITEDTVKLQFQKADGTLVTQFLDFQREVQIFRLMILSEEELALPSLGFIAPYQTVCFAMKLSKQDFIAADAIAKLRQKNPHTVRYPEEDNGRENATFDYSLDLKKSHVISVHIGNLCQEASAIYAQESDLRLWAAMSDANKVADVLDAAHHLSRPDNRLFCRESSPSVECQCRLNFCVPWYPCGLKFCRGHDQSGKSLSYRCGIKTCKKCLHYSFPTLKRQLCPWDD